MTSPQRPTGLVLAGGRSSRFGSDKAAALLGGVPLLHWVLERLAPLCSELLVALAPAGRDPSLPELPLPTRLVRDETPYEGPLAGIVAGLREARGARCIVTACDAPFLSRALLERMLEREGDVVLARVGGVLQPLPGVYARQAVLAQATQAFERGERRILAAIAPLSVTVLEEDEVRRFDPDLASFLNVNTREALAEATRRLSATS